MVQFRKTRIYDINIDELLGIQLSQINSIIHHKLVISETATCEGDSYFPLPKEQRNPIRGLFYF